MSMMSAQIVEQHSDSLPADALILQLVKVKRDAELTRLCEQMQQNERTPMVHTDLANGTSYAEPVLDARESGDFHDGQRGEPTRYAAIAAGRISHTVPIKIRIPFLPGVP